MNIIIPAFILSTAGAVYANEVVEVDSSKRTQEVYSETDVFKNSKLAGSALQLRLSQDKIIESGGKVPAPYLVKKENILNEEQMQMVDPDLGSSIWESWVAPEKIEKWSFELKNCIGLGGQDVYSKHYKKEYDQCFMGLDETQKYLDERGLTQPSYLDGIKYLASIASRPRGSFLHSCMASAYQPNKWITAKHCLTKNHIINGAYLIALGAQVKISQEMVSLCDDCDIAVIDVSGIQALKPAGNEPVVPATLSVKVEDEVFIAGIPEKTVLNDFSPEGIAAQLRWSAVGLGFCRVFGIDDKCLTQTCSTIRGFSGAPVYKFNSVTSRVEILAVHSGVDNEMSSCPGQAEGVNYATSILQAKNL